MANPSVRGYQKQNLDKLMQGCKMFIKNVAQPKLVEVLSQKADKIVELIDSGLIPEYTANLHDATGVAVYVDGTIKRFVPTARAQKATSSGYDGINHYGIWGSDFLEMAIYEASTRFSKGVWFVIFSAVPYAYRIDMQGSPKEEERGRNFFSTIRDAAINDIIAGLKPIGDVSAYVGGVML